MPTYEYECTRCKHITEEFKPMSAPRRQRCPKCRGKVERLISGGTGILFKGSGFYINDSRGKTGSVEQERVSTAGDSSPAAKPKAKAHDTNNVNKDKT